ncbi:hypothetical protein CDD81_6893 [Ophiocordyceps australis]|uniref:Repetitive proline-rich cell wall protein n=1 Tax=Ophiocordyceps australis TaxID=1399860 RepID=A0A2C5XH97_9HYPO|nr:hypothetical protein CDD81_6893 [Ophiocordyceps australis]
MVFRAALLAFAATALGNQVAPRGDYEHESPSYPNETQHTTMTTYTTTTVCPVTSTITSGGTTYWKTDLTTSTLTVTECHGCGGGVVTVPGPTVTGGTTTMVEVTYTTVCPVTETITGPTHTYVTTHTVTSEVVTRVPTTYYTSVPGPEKTATATDVQYTTLTSLCPVTKTTTIEGQERTITYTTTSLIKTVVPTTVEETYKKPDHTATATDVEYSTITSICPVTQTTTIGGKEYTTTFTTTKLIETMIPKTYQETKKLPDTTKTATDVEYSTITSICPVTETTTIGGKEYTTTYTTTKLIETKVPKTIKETKKLPDTTKTAIDVEYSTITSLCPVTEVTTISGTVHTTTYTTTKLIETKVPKTIQETKKLPDTTATATDVVYSTITSLCPVTQVTTIGGKVKTLTYTTTKLIETKVPVTVSQTVEGPDTTETATDVAYKTVTKMHPVTKVISVGGEERTVTVSSTKVVEVHQSNTIYVTVTGPGGEKTKTEYVVVTKTGGAAPVTETVVVPGPPVYETKTKTEEHNAPPETVTYSKPAEKPSSVYPSPPSTETNAPVVPPSTTSAEVVPTGAAQVNGVSAAALFVGVAGIMAVL